MRVAIGSTIARHAAGAIEERDQCADLRLASTAIDALQHLILALSAMTSPCDAISLHMHMRLLLQTNPSRGVRWLHPEANSPPRSATTCSKYDLWDRLSGT